jgi:cation transport ATPase
MESARYDRDMNTMEPTQKRAEAALAEASRRGSQVRRSDLQLRWMLLAILAAYTGAAVLISLGGPHRGSALAPWAIVGLLAATIVFAVVVGRRIRAYSRAGIRIYFASIVAFNLWNAIVAAVSIGTGFWAMGQPAYHFGLSETIAVLPLVIGAALVGRK